MKASLFAGPWDGTTLEVPDRTLRVYMEPDGEAHFDRGPAGGFAAVYIFIYTDSNNNGLYIYQKG